MTRVPRQLVAFGVAGVLLGIAAEAVAFRWADVSRWGPDLMVGWTVIGAGLFAAHRLPASRIGWLIVAAGMLWFIGNFTSAGHPVVAWLGAEALFLHRGPLIHAVLAFPHGHLRSRIDRATVVASYVAAFAPIAQLQVPAIAVGLLIIGAAWTGWRRSVGPDRRARLRVLPAGIALGAVIAGGATLRMLDTSGTNDAAVLAIYQLVVVGVAIGVTWQLVAGQWRSAAIADLIVGMTESRAAGVRTRLAQALGDPTLEVAYATEDGGFMDEGGRPIGIPNAGTRRAVTRVGRGETSTAALLHDPAVLRDPGLSDSIGMAVDLTATNARLRAEVRGQIAAVQASRRRLVRTGATERRGLQRRLQSGAMRRLAAVERLLESALAREPMAESTDASGSLERAAERVAGARRDMERLGKGLHPLAGRRLDVAIRELAAESPVPTNLAVSELDIPEDVAATVYFVCSEGLANAAKHAAASQCSISVEASGARIRLLIADDGRGGAMLAAGSGLRGLVDRVEALAGVIDIDSPEQRGTRIRVELPLPGN